MLKKSLALLIVFTIVLTILLGNMAASLAMATVTVVTESGSDMTDDPSASIAAVGGSLYTLHSSGKLKKMTLDTREITELGMCFFTGYYSDADSVEIERAELEENKDAPAVGILFAWDGQLYGLTAATGEWIRLLDDAGNLSPTPMDVKLDTAIFINQEDEYSSVKDVASLFAQDDALYFVLRGYTQAGMTNLAGSIDLKTGESKTFQTANLTQLAPWKDGKLMARVFDEQSMYSASVNAIPDALYGLFDPLADSFTELGALQANGDMGGYLTGGLCTDPDGDALYYALGGRVMGLDMGTGEFRISAYTGKDMFFGADGGVTLFADGHYARQGYQGADVYGLDTEAVKGGALRIFGEFGSEAHTSFSRAYPDIPVDVGETYVSDLEELTTAMVSGSDTYDVLLLNMSYMPVMQLREKGYCMELSQFPVFEEIARQMYPQFVEPLRMDGKLYALPTQVSARSMGVNMQLWTEELGLTEEDLPKSYVELLDFIGNWEYDYADEHGDMILMNGEPLREILFSAMLQDYLVFMQARGESFRFDTEVMRKLLTAFEQADLPKAEEQDAMAMAISMNSGDRYLFSSYMSMSEMQNHWQNMEALPLPLIEGEETVIGADLTVLVINPKTQRLEQALIYAEHYLKNLQKAGANITLFPEHNEPVEERYYLQNVKEIAQAMEKQNKLLEKAEESEKPGIEEMIRNLEESLASMEEWRYAASPKAIANYRENVVPLLHVSQMSSFMQGNTAELSKTMMKYLDGAIGQDQLLKEMDQMLRMMELEAQ